MAIDYKQLRAGNLVFNHKGEVHVITPWDIWNLECYFTKNMVADKRLEEWRYIPLDFDWLNSNEFKKAQDFWGYRVTDNIFLDEDAQPCISDRDGELLTIGEPLEFVHQLQNLIHSLTGVELEVKL